MLRYGLHYQRARFVVPFPEGNRRAESEPDISSVHSLYHSANRSQGQTRLDDLGLGVAQFDDEGVLRRLTTRSSTTGSASTGASDTALAVVANGRRTSGESIPVVPARVRSLCSNPIDHRAKHPVIRVEPILEETDDCWPWFARAALRCCGDADIADDWETDVDIRNQVSVEMTESHQYDTTEFNSAADAVATETNIHSGSTSHDVAVVPRFVAQVVVALHMKLGRGAKSRTGPEGQANVALVRRETARMLREYNVRDMDAAAHMDYIEKCFFEDETHSRVPRWRLRAASRGRFVRWLVGSEPATSHDC